jgi:small subunit ribosomal protein S18
MATMAPRGGGRGPGSGPGGGGGDDRRGGPGGQQGGKKKFFYRRKRVCKFCVEKIEYIDFKDVKTLQQFIPERGKILPRRISGTCALHQRKLQNAIKRARIVALLPFTAD